MALSPFKGIPTLRSKLIFTESDLISLKGVFPLVSSFSFTYPIYTTGFSFCKGFPNAYFHHQLTLNHVSKLWFIAIRAALGHQFIWWTNEALPALKNSTPFLVSHFQNSWEQNYLSFLRCPIVSTESVFWNCVPWMFKSLDLHHWRQSELITELIPYTSDILSHSNHVKWPHWIFYCQCLMLALWPVISHK